MKNEKFKYLYSFKYNNKEYIYLISKNYPFYFLEYNLDTNNFDYPNIDTFKELYSKFYSNRNILCFDLINDLKNIKKALFNMNFNITPLIRTTSGLLSTALVLSMCGCTQTNDISDANDFQNLEIVEVEDKSQQIYNYFKQYNMKVIDKEYDGNNYIFVSDFINNKGKHQITLQSYDEFRKFNGIDFIPTWEDVINAFNSNESIDIDKKNIILEGISNMRNSDELDDLDLSVLYVNAKKMKFNYLSSNEMINITNRDSVYAFF